jgi:hypothetical protein
VSVKRLLSEVRKLADSRLVSRGCAGLDRLAADPTWPFRAANMIPDRWQREFLADPHGRQALLCCRRSGKTTAAAGRTLTHCLTRPKALALILCPTLRQAQEYSRVVADLDRAIGAPVRRVRESSVGVEWANGSRLLCLPDRHAGVVGFTPTQVVIDEASRVSDVLYKSIRPMLALEAELVLLSTPFGKAGFFFDVWTDAARAERFHRRRVTWSDCPRIRPEFIAEERLELGDRWFAQEWECSFNDAVDAVFAADVINAAFGRTDDGPLFDVGG